MPHRSTCYCAFHGTYRRMDHFAPRKRDIAHSLHERSTHPLPHRYGASCTDEIVLFLPFQSSNDAYVPSPFGRPVLLTTQLPPS